MGEDYFNFRGLVFIGSILGIFPLTLSILTFGNSPYLSVLLASLSLLIIKDSIKSYLRFIHNRMKKPGQCNRCGNKKLYNDSREIYFCPFCRDKLTDRAKAKVINKLTIHEI